MRPISKTLFVIFLMLLSIRSMLLSQAPDTLWTRIYGGSGVDRVVGVMPTPDGGFMWAGVTPHDSLSDFDIWYFKTDAEGNMLWEEKIGRADSTEDIVSFELAWDGGFLMAGWMIDSDGLNDATILKLRPDGQEDWWFRYGIASEATAFHGVVSAPGGGAVAVGQSSLNLAGANFYTLGTFPSGLYMWNNLYDWGWTEIGRHICNTSDGGYVITGETNSFYTHSFKIFLQKLDISGVIQWEQLHGWEGDQYGTYVQPTPDNGFIAVGYSTKSGTMDDDVCIVKTDSLGNAEWYKVYGGESMDKATCVQVVANGYIVAGSGQKPLSHSRDVYLVKLDLNGDTLWTKYIGEEWNNETAYQIRQTSNGGYIIAGYRVIATGNSDAYLVRLAPDTVTAINTQQSEVPQNYILNQNYPNPFNPVTTIQFQLPQRAWVTLKIFDPLGKEIVTLINEQLPAGSYQKIWQARDLSSGIYFYHLKSNDFQTVKKMILMK